jgi:HSP20 family molecular chaperone IbpA
MRYYGPDFMKDFEGIADRVRDFFEEVNRAPKGKPAEPGSVIPCEVLVDRENVYVEVEVPGRRKEDLHVALKENSIVEVVVDETVESRHPGATRIMSDRNRSRIVRQIPIPKDVRVDVEKVGANYVDGVLVITIGRAHEEIRNIDIA